jgi:hypothetical protein
VTQRPNQQHVFYRGADGAIDHIFWDALSTNSRNGPLAARHRSVSIHFSSRRGHC